jgi:peptidoglycan/LPS O-acetylase OafA/YrhL
MRSMSYQPRLDGIRALAVLAVVAFHTTGLVPGGWLGVDVFFVLSGYLITTLLLRERDGTGDNDLSRFYWRRVLRLGPALLITLVLAVPVLLAVDGAGTDRGYSAGATIVGVLFYAANWMQVADPTSLGPLTHTWSLAIEEQFYLLWPLALILAYHRAGRKAVGWAALVLVGLIIVGRGLAVTVWANDSLWFATPVRADGLLLGAAAAAFGWAPRSGRSATILLVVSVLGLGALVLTAQEFSSWMLTGGLTLVALLSLCLVLSANHTVYAAPLEWPWLVWVGRVSYGVYLYHYLVYYAVSQWLVWHGAEAMAARLVGTVTLVALSWFLVERPALRLKDRSPARGPATASRQ